MLFSVHYGKGKLGGQIQGKESPPLDGWSAVPI